MTAIEWDPMAEIRRSTVQHETWVVTRLVGFPGVTVDRSHVLGVSGEMPTVEAVSDYKGTAAGAQRALKQWVLDQLEWAEFDRHRWVKVGDDGDILELQVAWQEVAP